MIFGLRWRVSVPEDYTSDDAETANFETLPHVEGLLLCGYEDHVDDSPI